MLFKKNKIKNSNRTCQFSSCVPVYKDIKSRTANYQHAMARRSYTVLQRVQHLRCICTCPPTTAMSNRNPDKFKCNAAALHTVGTRCCCRHAIKNNNRVVVKLALNAEINYLSARCAAREARCMPGFIPRAVLLHLHRLWALPIFRAIHWNSSVTVLC